MSNDIYPSWVHHRTLESRIVQTKEEHEALGSQWRKNPADFLLEEEPVTGEALEFSQAAEPKKRKGKR